MSPTTAKIITYVLQPLIMPFIGIVFLLNYDIYYLLQLTALQKFYILGFVFLITFALPALAAIMLKYMGYIRSLEMETREERKLPILVTAFMYTALFFLLGKVPGYQSIRIFILATTIAIIVSGFITNYYKISIHMTGCGGVVGLVALMCTYSVFNLYYLLAICIVFSGLVGVARLKLKAHTPMQVYTGFVFGFSMIFLIGKFL